MFLRRSPNKDDDTCDWLHVNKVHSTPVSQFHLIKALTACELIKPNPQRTFHSNYSGVYYFYCPFVVSVFASLIDLLCVYFSLTSILYSQLSFKPGVPFMGHRQTV